MVRRKNLTSIELCAGAGGQALGLEQAGFKHVCLIEIDEDACATLRLNRPQWNTLQCDLKNFSGFSYKGIDLVAGGVPCPPFSKAGKQLGANDERNLFDEALRIVREVKPKAIMLENVRGLLDSIFDDYREHLLTEFEKLGYKGEWRLLNASDFGVPQLRPRAIFVALLEDLWPLFKWPQPKQTKPDSVGNVLFDLVSANGWEGATEWAKRADKIAPTLVGGSKKHGGPDLGPTRAKKAWLGLDVDGKGIADEPPEAGHNGPIKLTVRMTARLQGFPDSWKFWGKNTTAYRQVGNAFPPPVACAVGKQIAEVLKK